MTMFQLYEKIEQLKKQKFYLAMKDHWSNRDFVEDSRLFNEINRLEKELREKEDAWTEENS